MKRHEGSRSLAKSLAAVGHQGLQSSALLADITLLSLRGHVIVLSERCLNEQYKEDIYQKVPITSIMGTEFQDRIEVNPKVMGGKPVVKGTRIPVYIILQMLGDGASFDDVVAEYPRITEEDIKSVLEYAQHKIDPDIDEEVSLEPTG